MSFIAHIKVQVYYIARRNSL